MLDNALGGMMLGWECPLNIVMVEELLLQTSARNVKQLISNGLLTRFVVGKC